MNVYTVTVTYGNRSSFVASLAERLMSLDVFKFVIIDNGSPPENKAMLKVLSDAHPAKVEVISLNENTGSAGGFKAGLMLVAGRPDCDFIWLLDDDNLPDYNALQHLLLTYQQLNENCCLVSLRKSRLLYR